MISNPNPDIGTNLHGPATPSRQQSKSDGSSIRLSASASGAFQDHSADPRKMDNLPAEDASVVTAVRLLRF